MAFRFNQTFDKFIKADIASGAIPFLVGECGIGKSSFVESVAADIRTACFTLAANQLADKADVTGARLVPQDDGEYAQVFYPHQVIQDAIRYAIDNPTETPLLFIDEINRTTPDVTSELLSIPTLRAIGSKKLPDNLRVICAGNDKGNVTALDEASISRFVVYPVEPDLDTFLRVNPELNVFIKNTLSAKPDLLFCKMLPKVTTVANDDDEEKQTYIEDLLDDEGAMLQITCPRTLTKFSEWLNTFDDAELQDMLATQMPSFDGDISSALQEAAIAHVGNTEFTMAFMLEVSSKINTVANQQNSVKFTPPTVYADLKAAQTVSDVNTIVMQMNNKDRSGCLLAALADQADDTSVIINAITPTLTNLDPQDVQTLMALAQAGKLSAPNITTFRGTSTPIATVLSVILDAYY